MSINAPKTGVERSPRSPRVRVLQWMMCLALAACGHEKPSTDTDTESKFTPITEELSSDRIREILEERMASLESKIVECDVGGKTYAECVQMPVANRDENDLVVGGLLDATETRYVRWLEKAILPRTSTEGTVEVPVEMMDEERFKEELFRLRFRRDKLSSYPDTSELAEYKHKLGESGGQKRQNRHHFGGKNPFEIFTNANFDKLLEKLMNKGSMVEVPDEGDYYFLAGIYSEGADMNADGVPDGEAKAKHVFKPTFELIKAIGEYVDRKFHEKYGLPSNIRLRLPVTALIRTEEYHVKLGTIMEPDPNNPGQMRKKYGNVAPVKKNRKGKVTAASSHMVGDAADIAFDVIEVEDTNTGIKIMVSWEEAPELLAGAEILATERLLEEVQAGKAYGAIEGNHCLHIVEIEEVKK